MREVFEKIKQKLYLKADVCNDSITVSDKPLYFDGKEDGLREAIEIVDQVTEEYAKASVEGDLISRSALQEDLRKCEEKCEGALILPSWLYACRIIKNQPSIQNDRWIPCSESLPVQDEKAEYYKSVIVTLDDGRVAEGCYRSVDKEWWVDAPDGEHYSEDMTGHVIAWQPLPAPYRKE